MLIVDIKSHHFTMHALLMLVMVFSFIRRDLMAK